MARRDIISALDFTKGWMLSLFDLSESLRKELERSKVLNYAKNKFMVTVFLEPSTRTRLSFHFAMKKIGGEVVDFGPEQVSSVAKGESFEDTIRMVDGYNPDVIVLRSSEPGSALKASEIAESVVINAGDGWNEHPTQALLDVYTIWRLFGSVDGIRVGIMGDLKHGRTVSSLSYALSKFDGVKIFYVAPRPLQVREEILERIGNVRASLFYSLEEVSDELDVLYVTRLQKERFKDQREYEALRHSYVLTRQLLEKLPKKPIILHPLPRTEELPTEVDSLPNAKYFEQAENGVYVRAALLRDVLEC